ncbi:MAG: ATP-binding protein [Alkaliphilus sp.]
MEEIKIGKNIIENLTTGMYADSRVIYREYIQNAADQIDEAKKNNMFDEDLFIEITIDREKRSVSVYDNATGIKSSEVKEKLANIADSKKEKGVDKGFRGIGRLGGLAYCEQLIFITSYKGEKIKTKMSWDAKKLQEFIEDPSVDKSAEKILIDVIQYEQEECDENLHFFEAQMINIREQNFDLLEKEKIVEYIAWNTPVPYNADFMFSNKIKEHIEEKEYRVDEYQIWVNGDDIHKRYKDKLYDSQMPKKYDDITDVEFKEFTNKKRELLAWMWFGISAFKKNIPPSSNEMKGLRLRKENIQIGDSTTLNSFFKETRGNGYFVGEVHAVHKDLIPNARRDYFNENDTRVEFDAELKYFFQETLHKVYHDANKVKNCYKKIHDYNAKGIEFETKKFVNKEEKEKFKKNLEGQKISAKKAEKDIGKIKAKLQVDKVLGKVVRVIEKDYNELSPINETAFEGDVTGNKETQVSKEKKAKYLTTDLSKLNRREKKVVEKIYAIIKEVLSPDVSDELIIKIQSELKK